MKHIGDIGLKCCGCRSCEHTCPVKAISMQINDEGFLVPTVNEDVCVNCGKCRRACPMLNWYRCGEPERGYAAYLRDKEKLNRSASGGAFTAIAETILANDGVVFGTANNPDTHMPEVQCARSLEELETLKNSKYVQSDTADSFLHVQEALDAGELVLFSGTPCQVAGLRRFLGKPYNNLYTVDIICHGVPSQKLYGNYLDWLGKQHGGDVKNYVFRSKAKHGWSLTYRADIVDAKDQQKTEEHIASLSPYYYSFLKGDIYRESCYQCPYADPWRSADLTIGDFWGIEREYPAFVNHDGVSAVLVNTEHGAALWERAEKWMVSHEVDVESIVRNQGNLNHPTHRSAVRDTVYHDLNEYGFEYVAKTYMKSPDYTKDWIKDKIPGRTRQRIKGMLKKLLGR